MTLVAEATTEIPAVLDAPADVLQDIAFGVHDTYEDTLADARRFQAQTIDSLGLLGTNDRVLTQTLQTPLENIPSVWGRSDDEQVAAYADGVAAARPSDEYTAAVEATTTLGLLGASDRIVTAILDTTVKPYERITTRGESRQPRWTATTTASFPVVATRTETVAEVPTPTSIEVPDWVDAVLTKKQRATIQTAATAGQEISPWTLLTKRQVKKAARKNAAETRTTERRVRREDQYFASEGFERAQTIDRVGRERRQRTAKGAGALAVPYVRLSL